MNVARPMMTFMTSLSTPTILFCIMNLVIGTIFITSRLKPHKKPDPGVNSPPNNQLVRVRSFVDRVKSFNFSSYLQEQPDPSHPVTQNTGPFEEQEQETVEEGQVLRESNYDDQTMMVKSKSERSVAAPASKGGPEKRILKKSFSEKAVVVDKEKEEEEVDRPRPATMRERKGRWSESETLTFREDEAVDEKADDFINRFRQQLKLQRMDSILRYKEMLNRGAGVGS